MPSCKNWKSAVIIGIYLKLRANVVVRVSPVLKMPLVNLLLIGNEKEKKTHYLKFLPFDNVNLEVLFYLAS